MLRSRVGKAEEETYSRRAESSMRSRPVETLSKTLGVALLSRVDVRIRSMDLQNKSQGAGQHSFTPTRATEQRHSSPHSVPDPLTERFAARARTTGAEDPPKPG